MKIGVSAHYSRGNVSQQAKELKELEKAGVDVIWVAESYSFDSPSALGYLAAVTETATLASGIMNFYSRTPATLAMTAAGIDAVSEGVSCWVLALRVRRLLKDFIACLTTRR